MSAGIASKGLDGAGARRPRSPLHRALAARLTRLFREQGLAVGDRLTEHALARALGVSRTPVRAALRHLADSGVVARTARGHVLARLPEAAQAEADAIEKPAEEALLVAIASARVTGALADAISEADLMRRFGVSRAEVRRVLATMGEAGVIARKPGYGWHFEPMLTDPAAQAESYRLRLLLEPAAILEEGFALDPRWAEAMRRRHQNALATPWGATSSVGFFEMNAAFHEGIARASGNRFIHGAIVQQSRVRRFQNYHWTLGEARVEANCRQHLEILDRLEAGDREVASLLLRRHIDQARTLED